MSEERYKIVYSQGFLRDVRKLPRDIQEKLAALLSIVVQDVFNPVLHTKSLSGKLKGFLSFRITRDYRTGFKIEKGGVVRLLAADNRKNIYKMLERRS